MSAVEQFSPRSRQKEAAAAVMLLILISDPLQALVITAVAPALTTLKHHFSAGGIFGAHMLMSMPGLGIILAGGPAGRLIERWGAARLLAVALPAYALCGAAGLVLDSLEALLLSRLLLGCATALIAGSALSIVAEAQVLQGRARLLSWQASLGALAGLLSLPIAGWLTETHGWRGPFSLYLLALLVWPAALMGLRQVPDAPRLAAPASSQPRESSRHLWPMLLGVVVVFAIIFMRSGIMPFILAEAGLTRPLEQAWTLAMECLLNALGALAFSAVLARLSPMRCMALCLFTMGLGNLLVAWAGPLPLKLIGMGLSAASAGFSGPALAYLLLDRAGPAWRKRASGLLFSAIYLGDFINPVPAALLRHAFGLHGMFAAIGLGSVAASLIIAWRTRRGPTT